MKYLVIVFALLICVTAYAQEIPKACTPVESYTSVPRACAQVDAPTPTVTMYQEVPGRLVPMGRPIGVGNGGLLAANQNARAAWHTARANALSGAANYNMVRSNYPYAMTFAAPCINGRCPR